MGGRPQPPACAPRGLYLSIYCRWDGDKEWSDQYTNYAKIMAYVNSQPDLHATIQWGTLAQYFKACKFFFILKDEININPLVKIRIFSIF